MTLEPDTGDVTEWIVLAVIALFLMVALIGCTAEEDKYVFRKQLWEARDSIIEACK